MLDSLVDRLALPASGEPVAENVRDSDGDVLGVMDADWEKVTAESLNSIVADGTDSERVSVSERESVGVVVAERDSDGELDDEAVSEFGGTLGEPLRLAEVLRRMIDKVGDAVRDDESACILSDIE